MSKVQYVGPRVEISNQGITYRKAKEDKYVYLMVALKILKSIDNDYEKKQAYIHHFENKALEEEVLHTILKCYESGVEEEGKNYELKMQQEIENIQNVPHLTDIDKEVWIKNIELMKVYRIQRAINKIYYIHCIQDIVHVIKHKKIKEITTPFNKSFFHVLNSIRGALTTGIYSVNTIVTEERNKDNNIVVKLYIDM